MVVSQSAASLIHPVRESGQNSPVEHTTLPWRFCQNNNIISEETEVNCSLEEYEPRLLIAFFQENDSCWCQKKILDLQDKCTAGGVLYTIAQVSRYSDGSSSICLLPFEHT